MVMGHAPYVTLFPESSIESNANVVIIGDIDPIYFTGTLPEGPSSSGKWVSTWQNCRINAFPPLKQLELTLAQ